MCGVLSPPPCEKVKENQSDVTHRSTSRCDWPAEAARMLRERHVQTQDVWKRRLARVARARGLECTDG
jgi:hypothetical protein